jgi:SPP1 family phage portal protein
MIKRSERCIEDGRVSREALVYCLDEHRTNCQRLDTLEAYMVNQPPIATRVRTDGRPNNRLIHNYARYIVKMASGYLIGAPVAYSDEKQTAALDAVTAQYKAFDASAVDMELAKVASKFGRATEVLYADRNARPRSASVDPRCAFVVYDDTVERKPLFGVYYSVMLKNDGSQAGYRINVYTKDIVQTYEIKDFYALIDATPVSETEHFFGDIPVNEYWNDDEERGDYEWVTSLIDALNLLQSDRVNDKEQFVNALLLLLGCKLEADDLGRSPAKQIKEDGILQLPSPNQGADAKYLNLTLDEEGAETLKKSIKEDIHKLSMVPDLTQDFSGNPSRVSMGYKLFGFTQLIKEKERYFREALRWRLRMMATFMGKLASPQLDAETVEITFSRSLPVNEDEIATMVQALQGIVPDEMLLKQIPWIEDPKQALDLLRKQEDEAAQRQAKAFDMPVNAPVNDSGSAAPKE